jgi:hypothetical protein
MKPRHPTLLSALVALLAALGPRVALAVERGCAAIAIEPDARFRAQLPDLLANIQSELAARTDIDACARVALGVEDESAVKVSVTLPDGRTASRSVARREDVMPTLQALLLVPQAAVVVPAAPEPVAPTAKRTTRQRQRGHLLERTDRDVPPPLSAPPRQFGFELSAISGVRLGDGQFGYGAGMLSFLQVHSWLIGFEGRADGYRAVGGSDPETALELAILAGKRFDFGSVALDVTAGPGVAMKGVTLSQSESVQVPTGPTVVPPAPPSRSEPSSGPVPRLLLGARLGFSPRSVFRTFLGIDGELGPSRSSADPEATVSSPRMPTFTLGLALGATVGTP